MTSSASAQAALLNVTNTVSESNNTGATLPQQAPTQQQQQQQPASSYPVYTGDMTSAAAAASPSPATATAVAAVAQPPPPALDSVDHLEPSVGMEETQLNSSALTAPSLTHPGANLVSNSQESMAMPLTVSSHIASNVGEPKPSLVEQSNVCKVSNFHKSFFFFLPILGKGD